MNKNIILYALLLVLCVSLANAQAPDTLWTKTYGGADNDEGLSIQKTSDGGYIIAGYTRSFGAGGADVWLLKTDENGDTLWTKTYGGIEDEWALSVQQTSDNGFIIVGWTYSFGAGSQDVYLIKTDSLGDTLWTRAYGGTNIDDGWSVKQTSDGGYIIAGYSFDYYPESNPYLIKTDANGDTLWTKTITFLWGWFKSIQQTLDGGYIVAGARRFASLTSYLYLMKINSLSDTLWTFTSVEYDGSHGSSIQQTSDGGYIVAGSAYVSLSNPDVYLIKTAPEAGIEEEKVESVKSSNFGATIFCGPLLLPEGKKCKVYDVTGRTVAPDKIKPGIYFIEIDGKITKKVVKVR